ncbi:MAG: chromate resistance protein [Acidobacteria bacterium]|nr:chromate resistance protein [Acidobacteriota bacterium]MBI3655097.1 chromate resistance protein [Acidobacteriota bacterium]
MIVLLWLPIFFGLLTAEEPWPYLEKNFLELQKTKADTSHTFSTWQGLEVDKCASAWLIKRFVDKEAVFKFFPKGDVIHEGRAFDTPDADLRRYQSLSTYESILKKFQIKDPAAVQIGKIVHDIELEYWNKPAEKLVREVKVTIKEILRAANDNHEALEKSFVYFDELYKGLKAESAK